MLFRSDKIHPATSKEKKEWEGFKRKPFKQGLRKCNKPGFRPFKARGAHIEEVDFDNEPEQDEAEELALRTSQLSDERREKFYEEMKALDINF